MISLAQLNHLEAINDIYNQAVEDGLRTAHTEPVSLTEREIWFRNHTADNYPVFVFTDNGNVLGWISLSPYRSDRQALDEVVEVSYYIDYNHHREGIATQLMRHAINFCQQNGYRLLVAILVSGNKPSEGLLKKFDFRESGRIPDAIHYNGSYRDHLYMHKTVA